MTPEKKKMSKRSEEKKRIIRQRIKKKESFYKRKREKKFKYLAHTGKLDAYYNDLEGRKKKGNLEKVIEKKPRQELKVEVRPVTKPKKLTFSQRIKKVLS